ncbi:MAG: DUF1501 domain-containing protein [Bacteroidota bacterium]
MKRRNFIKTLAPLGMTPLMVNGMPVRAMADSMFAPMFSCDEISDRALVLIQMHGGNDGINTTIPVEQHAEYMNLRPTIGIQNITSLDQTIDVADQLALHPQMNLMRDLYDSGMVNVVQGVNYENSNKSHFKGRNIWLTGGDSTTEGQDKSSGWFGRYLDHTYPNFPIGYPNSRMLDPIGLEFGSRTISLGFHRESGVPAGLALSNDPTSFYEMISGIGGAYPSQIPITRYGSEMQYLIDIQRSSDKYGQRLNDIYNLGTNMVTYPERYGTDGKWNTLAGQLRTVARLLSGGCRTKIFLVRITGFDTHTNQVESSDPTTGNHAELLYNLSSALKAFQDDLTALGIAERVMTVTFSEFGRQVGENGNHGTDHGTLAPMFVVGRGVNPGITGTSPNFSEIDRNNFTSFQYDYRQVFTTLLQDWLGLSDMGLQSVEFQDFIGQKLDLVNSNYDDGQGNTVDFVVDPTCYDAATTFPVGLLYFHANAQEDNTVLLNWATGNEINNSHFEIERSVDAFVFQPIARVEGAGNSEQEIRYDVIDEQPLPGISYYRLKQTDFDGTYTYHGIIQVNLEESDPFKARMEAYPNPATDKVAVTISAAERISGMISVYSLNGQKVIETSFPIRPGVNQKEISLTHLQPGVYVVEVSGSANTLGEGVQLGRTKLLVNR